MTINSVVSSIVEVLKECLKDTAKTAYSLFRVMIPIIIIVKICMEYGLVKYLAMPLEPIMYLVGLPAEMGLVWASGMLMGVYSSLALYASMSLNLADPLTVVQVTVLGTMILIAHGLPLEGQVSRQCGLNPVFQIALRFFVAVIAGLLIHISYSQMGMGTETAVLIWQGGAEPTDLLSWAFKELKQLGLLATVMFALILSMRILRAIKVVEILNFLLRPLLKILGIGKTATTMTVLGILLGLLYGSGLIIREVSAGGINRKDVFASFSLMSLSHALVEDTLLIMTIGASILGIFWVRLFLSLAVVAVLTRLYQHFVMPRYKDETLDAAVQEQA